MESHDRLEQLALVVRQRTLEHVLFEHWAEVRGNRVGRKARGLVLHVPVEEQGTHTGDHERGDEEDRAQSD